MVKEMIPHNALLVVSDAKKALLLLNVGSSAAPRLKVQVTVEAPPNPAAHLQGTDQSGHVMIDARRSSYAQTDFHELAEHKFAEQVADFISKSFSAETSDGIVLIAPPRMLAVLRKSLSAPVAKHVIAEHAKDLVHLTLPEMEQWLLA